MDLNMNHSIPASNGFPDSNNKWNHEYFLKENYYFEGNEVHSNGAERSQIIANCSHPLAPSSVQHTPKLNSIFPSCDSGWPKLA